MMRRQMKLAAVLVVVVLALTGFSTSTSGGKGSKSKGSSSSGGGCSNSKKSNSGYRHTDYSDDDYDDNSGSGSSGSTYGTPTPTATDGPAVRVIRCAQPRKGKRKAVTASVIELRSNDSRSYAYEVDVTFYDGRGNIVDTAETTTTLDAGDVRNLTVRMESPRRVSEVKRCEVTAQLL